MNKISVISPIYLAEKSIVRLIDEVENVFSASDLDYEIIFVDDRSPDTSWEIIQNSTKTNSKIKAVRLSRNFGQHLAITAGIAHAEGDFLVILDCDLQVSPQNILDFYRKAQEGYEIVYSHTEKRNHSIIKNIGAWFFYKFFNFLSGRNEQFGNRAINTFTFFSRKVAQEYLKLNDSRRHFLLSLQWLGFKSTFLSVTHQPSIRGKSSYTLSKLFKHALIGIITHSTRLLWISIISGLTYVLASFILLSYLLINYFLHGYKSGWFSTIFVILFSTGILLLFIGVACLYIENIFLQVKGAPLYIIDEEIGSNND